MSTASRIRGNKKKNEQKKRSKNDYNFVNCLREVFDLDPIPGTPLLKIKKEKNVENA